MTLEILTEHLDRYRARAEACGAEVRADGFVFSSAVDGSTPLVPNSISHRLGRLSKRLGMEVNLRSLRHFMGTAMLTDGTDLRTVAGRLGHGDGGATTLRVYTHFLPAPDRRAAEQLAGRIGPLLEGQDEETRREPDDKSIVR